MTKIWHIFITTCNSKFSSQVVTKTNYKVRQILQSVIEVYYKVQQLLRLLQTKAAMKSAAVQHPIQDIT